MPQEIQPDGYFVAYLSSNRERVLSADVFAAVGYHAQAGMSPAHVGWSGNFNINFRPHPAVETRLEISTDYTPNAARWLDYDFDPNAPGAPPIDTDTLYFADLDSKFLSFTLRQSVVITPTLTFQAYAQLFSDYALYGPFYEAKPTANRDTLLFSDLRPSAWPDYYSFYETQMNLNVVARWEYRPGSTLYAIYTRHQVGAFQPSGPDITRTVLPVNLFAGPATDSFMVKWTYYWTV